MGLKQFWFLSVFLMTTMGPGTPLMAEETVGVATMQISPSERQQEIDLTLWYPAGTGGEPALFGDNAVFVGTQGQRNAAIADGTFPVVVVSLGGMRAAPNLSGWIGADLASQGFVAVVVHPQRLRPGDASIAPREIWLRPADLSETLTALENNPQWATHIDLERVGALGFFLGGTSVLSLVGAQLDPAHYSQSCDARATGLDCQWFAQSNVDLRQINSGHIARSNLDPRIKIAIAVDPELTASFSSDSLSAITATTEIINLGRPGTILPGLEASQLDTLIPNSRYTTIENASQFSAFSTCKPKGAPILAEEGESEAICVEPSAMDRNLLHAEISEIIVEALTSRLLAKQ